ncbi:MAG: NUDIX domain-containing protein [Ignavibacteriae bacterium]|nr:NUDIX domain-containing protein [Ignavibacteriota bacterium]
MKHVAVGIIMKDGQVLACQRKGTARYPLKWEFPGGKLESNESAESALIRELCEELSIEPIVEKEFHRQEWTYAEGTDMSVNDGAFKVFYFLIRSFQGKPVNNAFEQIRWVTPTTMQTMDILEGNRAAIDLLVKHAKEFHTETESRQKG